MKRRQLLATVVLSQPLVALSGCIGELDVINENGGDDNGDNENGDDDPTDDNGDGVPECIEKEEWSNDITSGPTDPGSDSIADHHECANANRPEPTGDICTEHQIESDDEVRTYKSAGIKPYPDPPSTVDESAVTDFVYAYEEARSQNSLVERIGDRFLGGGVHILEEDTRALDHDGETVIIRIQYGLSYSSISGDGEHVNVSDATNHAAVYGVDETGIVRKEVDWVDSIDEDTLEDTPNPVEEGELLECF